MEDKILFIGYMVDPKKQKNLIALSKKGFQNQANNFQMSIIQGLIKYEDGKKIEVIALPSFGSFFFSFKKLIIRKHQWKYFDSSVVSPGFINLPILKHFIWFIYILATYRRLTKVSSIGKIFFYSPNLLSTMLMFFFKTMNKTTIAISIITDLPPSFLDNSVSLINSLRKSYYSKLLEQSDFFISVSNGNMEKLNIPKDRFFLMPGFIDEGILLKERSNLLLSEYKFESLVNIIYAGNMEREFGIYSLIDAFIMSNNSNLILHICGFTNDKTLIRKMTTNTNIIYYGYVDSYKLSELYEIIDIFFIPRSNKLKLNSYSPPSKIFEYLSYLRPLYMFRFDGLFINEIPIVYYFEEHNSEVVSISRAFNKLNERKVIFVKEEFIQSFRIIINDYSPIKMVARAIQQISKSLLFLIMFIT